MKHVISSQNIFLSRQTWLVLVLSALGLMLPAAAIFGQAVVNIAGYSDGNTMNMSPTVACQRAGGGYTRQSFPYTQSPWADAGEISRKDCVPTSAGNTGSMKLLAGNDKTTPFASTYAVNAKTGIISPDLGTQPNEAFFYPGFPGPELIVNFGVGFHPEPLGDQVYLYTGEDRSQWMEDLIADSPGIKLKELVLPGSHDAGMYKFTNPKQAVKIAKSICASSPILKLEFFCKHSGLITANTLQNTSLTQKDDILSQLAFGTRYFDLRPAAPLDADTLENITHVHNFIQGDYLGNMLAQVNQFLEHNEKEIVILRVKPSGINTDYFKFISADSLTAMLDENITYSGGYQLFQSLAVYNDRALSDFSNAARLLVQYGSDNEVSMTNTINNSYSYGGYDVSLTDPSHVIRATTAALSRCGTGNPQYTILQLQDTGSAALLNYLPNITKNLDSWKRSFKSTDFGNILQATKAIFDYGTYTWLLQKDTLDDIKKKCGTVLVLLNDFVDVGLATNAIGISKYRGNLP